MTAEILDLEMALIELQDQHCAPESARILISHFTRRIERIRDENAVPLSAEELNLLFEYLNPAFVNILKGTSADVALGLKPGKGRPRSYHVDRNLVIAAKVEAQVRNDILVRSAIENVAIELFPRDTGYSEVRAVRAAHRKVLAELTDAEVSALACTSPEELTALMSLLVK